MGKVKIINTKDTTQFLDENFPELPSNVIKSKQFRQGMHPMHIFIMPDASSKLMEEIQWGQNTSRNRNEQGGALIGSFCKSNIEGQEQKFVKIEAIIPCQKPEKSTPSYIFMSSQNWVDIEMNISAYNKEHGTTYVMVGWYHTHPGNIPTAFSGIDEETQLKRFAYPYSVGIVLNPQKKAWTSYYGPEATEGQGFMLLPSDQRQLIIPPNSIKQSQNSWVQASYEFQQKLSDDSIKKLETEIELPNILLFESFRLEVKRLFLKKEVELKEITDLCISPSWKRFIRKFVDSYHNMMQYDLAYPVVLTCIQGGEDIDLKNDMCEIHFLKTKYLNDIYKYISYMGKDMKKKIDAEILFLYKEGECDLKKEEINILMGMYGLRYLFLITRLDKEQYKIKIIEYSCK